MSAKSVKKDVFMNLGLIEDDQLEEVLTDLDLVVSAEKRKKSDAVFSAISRHLSSEAVEDLEDEGLSVLLQVQLKLNHLLEENRRKDISPNVDSGDDGTETKTEDVTEKPKKSEGEDSRCT